MPSVELWVLWPKETPEFAISSHGKLAWLADGESRLKNVVVRPRKGRRLYHTIVRALRTNRYSQDLDALVGELFHGPEHHDVGALEGSTRESARGSARLTPEAVEEICQMEGRATQKTIAKLAGVNQPMVSHILNGHRWTAWRERARRLHRNLASAGRSTPSATADTPSCSTNQEHERGSENSS